MTPDEEQLLARALADYLDQQANQETVDTQNFCGRYAGIGPELQRQIEALAEIDRAFDDPAHIPECVPEDLPARLSGHRILSEIGSGGMGRVFLAVDEGLGRNVAIKTLNRRYLADPALRVRFMREARSMARISHPNIVRIYNLGTPEEQPHFVMELVEGVPLTHAARPLTIEQKADLIRKVAVAVQFLHDNQLLHRDLKPGNILVGADLEPKLLDFGLALPVDDAGRLTVAGVVMGTPNYFSPEQSEAQTKAQTPLDARSDVFSLGTILYEILTGVLPFAGSSLREKVEAVRQTEPMLPRRIRPDLPSDLQNVCLKALEKDPRDRYQSARELAADLERFLAGEPVLAAPAAYSRLMAGKIPQHLAELESWKNDHLISDYEFDSFRRSYGRLVEREDAWIMEVRRLSLPQVSLYLGAWVLVVAATLLVLFRYTRLTGTPVLLAVLAAAAPTLWIGLRCWTRGQLRIAIAYLLAFCLLMPVVLQVAMVEYNFGATITAGQERRELFGKSDDFNGATNLQMWWSLLLSLPVYLWLRQFTRSHVFSLVLAVMAALLCLVTLLRMGVLEWDNPGRIYLYLIPWAVLFFAAGFTIEHFNFPDDARYFYPLAVVFTLVGLSGVAAQHHDYAGWLGSEAPWTYGQHAYLFIVNAGIYLALQTLCERFSSPHIRNVGNAFRFVIPGHVMTSLLVLGMAASDAGRVKETHVFQVLLPIVACGFIFLSIPKQMKNFLASGLVFLAIGIVWLQLKWFKLDYATWPVFLLVAGLALMLAAANYARLKMGVQRLIRRKQLPS